MQMQRPNREDEPSVRAAVRDHRDTEPSAEGYPSVSFTEVSFTRSTSHAAPSAPGDASADASGDGGAPISFGRMFDLSIGDTAVALEVPTVRSALLDARRARPTMPEAMPEAGAMPEGDRSAAPPRSRGVSRGDVVADKYRIEAHISTGGMGVVYGALDLGLQRRVAIKMMRPEMGESGEAMARFMNEARASAMLRGEHAVHVLDAGTTRDGAPFLVMDFLEGADFCTLLTEHGPMPVAVAIDRVLQACEGLAEAHMLGIVHRDLKPENLFLTHAPDGSEVVKVLDFGISKRLGSDESPSLTDPGHGVGSPHYMSPEQMKTPDDIDARADVWSLGASLFELLTGQLAFAGATVAEVCARVIAGQPAPVRDHRPEVPARLEAVIVRCMRMDREDRFSDLGELARALRPFGSSASAASALRIGRILHRTPTPARVALCRPARPPSSRTARSPVRTRALAQRALLVAVVALASATITLGASRALHSEPAPTAPAFAP